VGKTDDSVGLYNFAAGGWESLILRHQYQKQISSLCVRALILGANLACITAAFMVTLRFVLYDSGLPSEDTLSLCAASMA